MVRVGFALCVVGLVAVLAGAVLLALAPVVGGWAAVVAAVLAAPALLGLLAGPVVLAVGLVRRRTAARG